MKFNRTDVNVQRVEREGVMEINDKNNLKNMKGRGGASNDQR